MEGDGLPTPAGSRGGGRGRVRSSNGGERRRSTGATREMVAEVPSIDEMEGAEHKEIQLPEECWVEILRSGGVREMCTMSRTNRCGILGFRV